MSNTPQFPFETGPGEEPDALLHTVVEKIVRRSPELIAVKFGRHLMSYRELDRRANRLAGYLVRSGVNPEDPVGVCLERSVELIVAVLAVLKSGGACVPLDPTYPADRIRFMVADCRPAMVLTQRTLAGRMVIRDVNLICLDEETDEARDDVEGSLNVGVTGKSLAYLLYTSGSTGQPKAVAMEHGAFCNLLRWQIRNFKSPAAAKTLQFASLNFDVAFQEIFSTLGAGGTVVVIAEEVRRDPATLLTVVKSEAIERLFLPFVALQGFATAAEFESFELTSLREVITAGEQLKITPEVRNFFSRHPECVLQNQYGPTETHVATAYTLEREPRDWPELPPIGIPITGATILLLDESGQTVLPGNIGELHIGGQGVARGYLNRPELTAKLFYPDPSGGETGARVYKTGDFGRYLPDGNLEFVGRRDDQIKVRGERVELGEVEAAILQHLAVQYAAVVALREPPYELRLAAYFVRKRGQQLAALELQTFLSAKVSGAMIPSLFIELEQIPLTPSGKLDRDKLPEAATQRARPVIAPRDYLEENLVTIISNVLRVRSVGIRDNFFELGGHSLLAAQVAFELRQKLGVQVGVAAMFKYPTIEEFAAHLRHKSALGEDSRVVGLNETGARPAFFCVPSLLDVGRHLGPDQPFYGLELREHTRLSENARDAISEMAARGIELIRTVQPRGPYYLGGYSFGGPVAFEMVRRLRLFGEEIALLVLIDPDPPAAAATASLGRHLLAWSRRITSSPVATMAHYLRAIKERTTNGMHGNRRFSSLEPEQKVMSLVGSYRAVKIDCRIAIFLGDVSECKDLELSEARRDWIAFAARGVELEELPGDHASLVEGLHAKGLAERLQIILDKSTDTRRTKGGQ